MGNNREPAVEKWLPNSFFLNILNIKHKFLKHCIETLYWFTDRKMPKAHMSMTFERKTFRTDGASFSIRTKDPDYIMRSLAFTLFSITKLLPVVEFQKRQWIWSEEKIDDLDCHGKYMEVRNKIQHVQFFICNLTYLKTVNARQVSVMAYQELSIWN